MRIAASPAPTIGLVPIVIGVTGHRDIPAEDVPRLTEVIATQLEDILRDSPNSPYIFLSALAEGADRVAELLARLNADTEEMELELVGDDQTLRLLAATELDTGELPEGLIDDVLARAIATLDAALPQISEITCDDTPAST